MPTKGSEQYVHLVIHQTAHNGAIIYACANMSAAEDKVLEVAEQELSRFDEDSQAEMRKFIAARDDDGISDKWMDWTGYDETLEITTREILIMDPGTLDLMEESRNA